MFKAKASLLAATMMCLGSGMAQADIDSACDLDGDGQVDDFNLDLTTEEAQQWNLANATSLAFTSSPLVAPKTYDAFQFALSLELNQFDYLTCQERTVLSGTKSEDTNKTPVIPRFKATLGLPMGAYISLSGLPPLKIAGVRTGTVTAEAGIGKQLGSSGFNVGLRGHLTGGQIIGDIAHPFGVDPDDPDYDTLAIDDEYQFINLGADISLGREINLPVVKLNPYVGGGVLSASSIFYVPETPFEVFAGDYFLDYQHEEIATELYEGFRGVDFFAGLGGAIPKMHLDGALEMFFIPVRAVIPEVYNTPEGLKSEYITNMVSVRLRVGYTF